MFYKKIYNSPLGKIYLIFDEEFLLGLYFENQKYFGEVIKGEEVEDFNLKKLEIINKNLETTEKWLDIYFSGEEPKFMPCIKLIGTEFRRDVWKILLDIPYGETITYKAISEKLIERGKYKKMSAQGVGGAVGHNPISIIVPCHRVIGVDGSLKGYAGGIAKKKKLLQNEGFKFKK
ncbi:methylated-DNA--[protein]-cysteine S-methyltransferase [Peptoniphilus porci]|uniref:methylated-DNA--[protein]-cysteine S-methyltransferase n=1 Tax=Peptoniphilus porci TaxID=2652280 RepID=A0A1U7M1G7_9FIRM|nr:methylated-DNA--[protein]-cysteine S-methyltransferase [Peptoniphilus porci]OLR65458.1 6-O-methylguanine DNA methyltransferase [Peptoniphilus porci]